MAVVLLGIAVPGSLSRAQESTSASAVAPSPTNPPPAIEVEYLPPWKVPKLPQPPKHYRAPPGFAGHRWDDMRVAFDRLPAEPIAVRAAWSSGKQRPQELVCRGVSRAEQQPSFAGCTIDELLQQVRADIEGGGFHVLSEYSIEGQGYKFSDTGVLLYPVIYQFCANWQSHTNDAPANFDRLNKFCGMRMLFDTETRVQLRELPQDHVSRYDLVLAELIANYGKPNGYFVRGRVTLEPVEETVKPDRHDRKFSTWRWCPPPLEDLETRCRSSIILSIDPEQGRAVVLFSSPELWQYAYAREEGSARPDPLFTLMHALQPKARAEERQVVDARKKANLERAARIKAAREARASMGK